MGLKMLLINYVQMNLKAKLLVSFYLVGFHF